MQKHQIKELLTMYTDRIEPINHTVIHVTNKFFTKEIKIPEKKKTSNLEINVTNSEPINHT